MNKKIILIAVITVIVFIISYNAFKKNPKNVSDQKNITRSSSFSGNNFSFSQGAIHPDSDYKSILNRFELINYDDFMDGIKKGRLNFVWEIWALRKNCKKESSLEQCNNHIITMIEKNTNFSTREKEKLKRIFTSYFRYEREIRDHAYFKKKNNFSEKYEKLKSLRREFFSEDDARLVFGMEESQVDFLNASANFSEKFKDLSGEEKVKKYENMKKEKYGDYYDAMVKREDSYQNYQTELNLLKDDFKTLSGEDKSQKIRSVLEKHFGKKEAEKILKEAEKEEKLRLEREKKTAEN